MAAKIKFPKGVTSVSYEGSQYDVGKDGTIVVDNVPLAQRIVGAVGVGVVIEERPAPQPEKDKGEGGDKTGTGGAS